MLNPEGIVNYVKSGGEGGGERPGICGGFESNLVSLVMINL